MHLLVTYIEAKFEPTEAIESLCLCMTTWHKLSKFINITSVIDESKTVAKQNVQKKNSINFYEA